MLIFVFFFASTCGTFLSACFKKVPRLKLALLVLLRLFHVDFQTLCFSQKKETVKERRSNSGKVSLTNWWRVLINFSSHLLTTTLSLVFSATYKAVNVFAFEWQGRDVSIHPRALLLISFDATACFCSPPTKIPGGLTYKTCEWMGWGINVAISWLPYRKGKNDLIGNARAS